MNQIESKLSPGNIICAHVECLDTGEIYQLNERPNSRCHFFEPIEIGNYRIQLRLDWATVNNVHPTLDADFYEREGGRKLRITGERQDAHNTSATSTEGRLYVWKFKSHQYSFRIRITIRENITVTALATARCTAEVIPKYAS